MCFGGKDFYGSSCCLQGGDRAWVGLQMYCKPCHMPDFVMKCSIFLQAELKDKEGGFHVGRYSCEETGMRGQKVGCRKIIQKVSENVENCFSQRLSTRGHSKCFQQLCQGWFYRLHHPKMKHKHPSPKLRSPPQSPSCSTSRASCSARTTNIFLG